jgi:putative flippase GtrA
MKGLLEPKLFRFLGVGAFNTIFGYLLYAFFLFIGLIPEIALLAATALGMIFNFFTFSRLVFSSRDNKKIIKFVILYVLIYAANSVSLRFLVKCRLDPYMAQIIMIPLMAFIAFLGQRRFVFRENSSPGVQKDIKIS